MKTGAKITFSVGLFVYGLFLFSALTFYRLPADEILSAAINRATHGEILVTAEKSSSSLWKGHHLQNLKWTIDTGSSPVVEPMESLTLSPNLFRLFQGYLPINLRGVLAKGSFQGSAGISIFRGLNRSYASLEAHGIQLENLAVINSLAQREIKGKLRGKAHLYGTLKDPARINGRGTIIVEDGAMDMRADAFGLQTLPFEEITLPITVKNGIADLNGGEIKSPLFGGDLEGQVRLHQDFLASQLHLTARIRPGPSTQDGRTAGAPGRGSRVFVIELKGTIGKPLISWSGDIP
jgi:type II secretion system protein N